MTTTITDAQATGPGSLEMHDFQIRGVSSLLMHNPAKMGGGPKTQSTVKTIPTHADEAEAGTYRDEDGSLYLPSNMFRASLLAGAAGRRYGKMSARTVLAGSVFNVDTRTPLLDPSTGGKVHDYEINVQRVVVQRAGILRARPEIPKWSCVVRFEIDLDYVQPFQVEEILNVAGRMAGVGDFRPGTKGPHGRYTAEHLPQGVQQDGGR